MFGIEIFEVLIFFRQLGLSVAGAAAFWGCVFLFLGKKTKDARSSALWQGVSQKLILIFFPAFFLFSAVWAVIAISQCVFCINAHEGISIAETSAGLINATYKQYGLYVAYVILGLAGFAAFLIRRAFFYKHIGWFFGAFFLIISALLLYPWAPLGSFRHDIAASLHGWHSIFTLGSVVIVDFLFIALKFNLRPYLTKIFPLITGGVWLGLGLDFINVGLIFQEEFLSIPRILFMQTLIGIVIINGALLSGPISRAIISFQERMNSEYIPSSLKKIVGISGAVSITAWASVTALDGFRSLTLTYWQIAFFYILFAGAIFLSRGIFEKILERYSGD